MNLLIIVFGSPETQGHVTLLINQPAPAPGRPITCPCGYIYAVERTLSCHTTEYKSRCLVDVESPVDERRTTQ